MHEVTPLVEVTSDELLKAFADNVEFQKQVEKMGKDQGAVIMVLFENLQMDSSKFGEKQILFIGGPTNTYKTLEDIRGQRLGDVPSRFQYPTKWARL